MRKEDRVSIFPRDLLTITIVHSSWKGKTLEITPRVLRELGNPPYLQFKISNSKRFLFIGARLGGDYSYRCPKNGDLYNERLVNRLADKFSLDIENYCRLSFDNISIKENDNFIYAVVKIWNKDNTLAIK